MNKSKAPGPSIPPDEYSRILRGLTLVDLRLSSCSAASNAELASATFGKGVSVPVSVDEKASYETSATGTVVVHHQYTLRARSGRAAVLSVQADYELRFRTNAEFTADFFEVFKDLAVPMFTWPYFREFLSSVSSRMDLPPLNLGLRHAPSFGTE